MTNAFRPGDRVFYKVGFNTLRGTVIGTSRTEVVVTINGPRRATILVPQHALHRIKPW